MNSLSVYISDKFYITSVLKMFLRGIEFQVNTSVCLFKSLMRLFPCLLDYILLMKSLLSFLSLFLCVSYLPSLASLKFFSSSLVFNNFILLFLGIVFVFSFQILLMFLEILGFYFFKKILSSFSSLSALSDTPIACMLGCSIWSLRSLMVF